MFHSLNCFAGERAVITGSLIPPALWCVAFYTKKDVNFYLDANGKEGAFEPFLAKYLKLAEIMIGLATGSIVLLVGSSALHGEPGHVPKSYASPLFLLAFTVLYGLLFSVWMTFHYEMYQHDQKHPRWAYALSETLGFSGISCFVIGYVWLIVRATY
jgi:hypothetical protein